MGIVSIDKFGKSSQLGIWSMTETVEVLYEMASLSTAEQKQYQTKKTDIRKKEWLACRVLLWKMTGQKMEIQNTADGKPLLRDGQYHLSLSHSGIYAAVYIDKTKPVGLDIQKFKPSISAGADFFLHDDELKWVDIEQNALLHLIWSVKETVFKCIGNKDIDFKKDIILFPFQGNQNGLIEVTVSNGSVSRNLRARYLFFDDYVLTWTA